jgi:hypothetical protein
VVDLAPPVWLTAATVEPLSHTERVLTLALAVAVSLAVYLLTCLLFPFANCSKCRGNGKTSSPSGKTFRNCSRCKGTGRRTRLGRRLLDRRNNR